MSLSLSHIDFEQPSDSTELEEYEEYCRRELPCVVRAAVEGIVSRETQPIENRLISEMESIILNAQHQVYASFRLTCTSNTANRPASTTNWTSLEASASNQLKRPLELQNDQIDPFMTESFASGSRSVFLQQGNNTPPSSDNQFLQTLVHTRSSPAPLPSTSTSVELPGLEQSNRHLPLSEASPLGQTTFGTTTASQEERNFTNSSQSNGPGLKDWALMDELVDAHDNTLHPKNPYPAWDSFESNDFDWEFCGS